MSDYPRPSVFKFHGREFPYAVGNWFDTMYESGYYDYMDNYRWALASDPEQVAKFEEAEELGCCGSHNETITGPDGLKYLVGFNYGH